MAGCSKVVLCICQFKSVTLRMSNFLMWGINTCKVEDRSGQVCSLGDLNDKYISASYKYVSNLVEGYKTLLNLLEKGIQSSSSLLKKVKGMINAT